MYCGASRGKGSELAETSDPYDSPERKEIRELEGRLRDQTISSSMPEFHAMHIIAPLPTLHQSSSFYL